MIPGSELDLASLAPVVVCFLNGLCCILSVEGGGREEFMRSGSMVGVLVWLVEGTV